MDILTRTIEFLNATASWFEENIFSGLGQFLYQIGLFLIALLRFLIDVIQWLISFLQ